MSIELDYMEYANNALAQAAYVTSDTPGAEKIINGSFDSDVSSWSVWFQNGAGSLSWDPGGFADVEMTVGGSNEQFRQDNRVYGTSKCYIISFRAKASSNGMEFKKVSLSELVPPYRSVIFISNVSLTTEWQWFSGIVKTLSDMSAHTIPIFFMQNWTTGHWYVDDVSIKECDLQSYSEASIKEQGSYSLKGVAEVDALNDTLTRAVSPTIDLTDITKIKLYIRASRIGSNIKVGIHDFGGTTTEITPNIASADTWQTVEWDISGVSNANKDAIDQIIITIVNADARNIFYVDNMFASTWTKTYTENLTLADTLQKRSAKIFPESITLADTLQKRSAKIFIESLSLADTLQKKLAKTFTESITLTDIYSRVWNIYRTFTEILSLTDTLIKKPIKTFIESLHLADTLIKRPAKIFSETITLVDTLKKRVHKTFTETLSLADTVSKKIIKTFLETLHLQDRYTRIVTWYRTFTEKITLTDTVIKVKSNLVQLWKKLMNLFDIEG